MNCSDATMLISAYADGETDRQQTRSIRQHLAACPECAARHERMAELRNRVRSEVPRYSAPPGLRASVLASIDAARRSEPARVRVSDRWRWLTGGALAANPSSITNAISNLNTSSRKLNTVFTLGPQRQMVWNACVTFTPFNPNTFADFPRYCYLSGPSFFTAPSVAAS